MLQNPEIQNSITTTHYVQRQCLVYVRSRIITTGFHKHSFKLQELVHPPLKYSCRLRLMYHESSWFNVHDTVPFHTCSAWLDCHVRQHQTDVNSLVFMLPKYILIA